MEQAPADRMGNTLAVSAAVVDALGHPRFADVLLGTFQSVVNFDSATVFAFDSEQRKRPVCVAKRCAHPEFDVANNLYVDKHFQDCELIRRLRQKQHEDKISLIRLSAQEIVNSDYRRDLYEVPGIAHDMMLMEEVGDFCFTLELFRGDDAYPFTEDEESRVRDFWPMALACIRKHGSLARLPATVSGSRAAKLGALIKLFSDKGVTRREAEVCAHIALGHSTVATSLHLSISVNTVSTLRQRAYTKLNISCMNELHALCLESFWSIVRQSDPTLDFLGD